MDAHDVEPRGPNHPALNPAPHVLVGASQIVRNFAGLLDAGPSTIAGALERLRARSDGRVQHAFVWIEADMVTDADVLTMSLGLFVWMLGHKGKIERGQAKGAPSNLLEARLLAAVWGRATPEALAAFFDWTPAEWCAFAAIPWRWSAGVDSACVPKEGYGYSFGIPRHMHEPEARALS